MRLPFLSHLKRTFQDIQEISSSTIKAFVETFYYTSDDSNDNSDSELVCDSDSSDLEDFDPSTYGCGEITESVEEMVEALSEDCKPLEGIYGKTASEIIKKTITTAREETECTGLKFFSDMTPGEDRDLIASCTAVCYWCCCETIKKVSPIIADATLNLLRD